MVRDPGGTAGGVVYHAAGLQRLRAVLGHAVLSRLLLLGERVPAPDLAVSGALAHVVPAHTLTQTVASMVEALQAGAPLSQRAHRDFFRALGRGQTSAALVSRHEEARARAYARIREDRVAKPGDSG